jgi:HAMP domain-containing protein
MHRDKAAKRIRNQTIQTRLTTAFIGLAVGPLLIVGVLAIWQGLSYQKESIRLQQQLAERVSVEVEGFITGLENDLRLAVKLQGVQNLGDRQNFSSLSLLLSFNNVYEELALLDNNGNELNKVARLEIITDDGLDNRAGTPDFEIPFTTGQTYFSPVRFDASTGEPLLTISIPIFDERLGEPQGALSAVVRLKSIWDLIAQIPLGNHQSVYIVDSDGRIVAHRNPSVVLRGTTFSLPANPGVSTGLDAKTVILAMDEIKLGGQTLTIVAEQALSEALELPINLLKTTLAVSFFSFASAGLIGLRSVRRIVKPIQDLAATAHAIRDGDLTRQAPVDQSDEVGELAETFNTMTAQLHQTMQGLEHELDERHRIAEELRLSEIRIRAMFTAIPDT